MWKKILVAAGLGLLALCGPALAADYPERPVKLILPYPPGGSFDGPTRILAERLGRATGQPFVVENRGGVGGTLGAMEVRRATPDGYTVLVSSGALPIASALAKKPPFDAAKDFRHVATFASVPLVVVVNPKRVPYGSFKAFMEASKASPGKFAYASAGNGSPAQLGAELIKEAFGVDWMHVPYRGTGPALADLIGGQVDVSVVGLSSAIGQIKSGALKALAVTTRARVPQLPDVPALAEPSPGFEFETWLGLSMPAGTPADVVRRLGETVEKVMKEQELQSRLSDAAVTPLFKNAAATEEAISKEMEVYSRLGQRTHISIDL
ncbi:tripartite tricarboxylate transporter substrate binding protein [Variovorax paradoxus]|uniref:Bug family tripartite tricarboxylate transporter substrate binding protein n=1 Tax=Variovorax paradoxus TaxID=34073 RepID=UPI001932CA37|nr:tripartite tricarboxylate transporter substrate binding protein [Variovorax paradoxus]